MRDLKRVVWVSCLITMFAAMPVSQGAGTGAEQPIETQPASTEFQSTHKQSQVIRPLVDGKPVALNTFCLDQSGNILACVGGSAVQYVMNGDGSQVSKSVATPQQVQAYTPEGKLIWSSDLDFKPTAINMAPDGSIFVAGMGRIAKLTSGGKVLTTADSPHVGDLASFRQRIEEGAMKQAEANKKQYQTQVTRIDARIKAIEDTAEEDRTEQQTSRLTTYKQQKKLYEAQLSAVERSSASATGAAAMSRKLGITALAVTSRDVFVCGYSVEGTGYEVWRMDHEFSSPKMVVSQLSGCCGQCDIQATESHLVLAENTKFKVALLDRDGERLADFGKGDRKAVDGFGSCCNPMNVRCCENGDILTAESSVGAIKRFNNKGELIGVVGKAKIGGGCKHVAVAFDQKRDRYYLMNVDKDHICVLVPNAEAGDATADEVLAKQARAGLGEKLVGAWTLAGVDEPSDAEEQAADASTSDNGKVDALKAATVARSLLLANRQSPYSSTYYQFDADGTLHTKGGLSSVDQGWECLRQEGDTLFVARIQGDIQYLEFRIEFAGDDEVTLSVLRNEQILGSNRFRRATDTEATQN